jgi:hypothetical protein
MLARTSMLALAAIATIATIAVAPTGASAAQVDFYLSRIHGGWDSHGFHFEGRRIHKPTLFMRKAGGEN